MRAPLPERVELTLGLDDADDDDALKRAVAEKLRVPVADVPLARIARRVIDARKGTVRFHLVISTTPPIDPDALGDPVPQATTGRPRVVVVGDGPCGLFCAYELARMGIASVVVDRGKTVNPRRLDLRALNRPYLGTVNEDSNYCFGEGGAGTYSDGKLYTRATKRGDVRSVYETLVRHHAPTDILTDARPHIGSNLLPKVVTAMRERLEGVGVTFRFGARVTGLITSDDKAGGRRVTGVRLTRVANDGPDNTADVVDDVIDDVDAVVIATGHSARDVFRFLHDDGVALEAKAFALGVRIEHPQSLINGIQYGRHAKHPKLPSAAYSITHSTDQGGVFSFCMCPGGFVVPASTTMNGLVVNGMSLKGRDNAFANSGFVASISVEDAAAAGFTGPLGLMALQDHIERANRRAALQAGAQGLAAPAARVTDFVRGRLSATFPGTSYQPGLVAADLAGVLDSAGVSVASRLKEALMHFGKSMRGYAGDDAVLIGVESRTSSPVRIPRDKLTLQSPDIRGLFPAGEGAGYAGGIVSAALDGIRVARGVAAQLGVHAPVAVDGDAEVDAAAF
jgi:uncharacterized FAD-dependent dehydrogenase